MKTKLEISSYKGSPVFTIWEIDDNGEKQKYPVVSFGKKKGEAILKYLPELEKFAGKKEVSPEAKMIQDHEEMGNDNY